MSTRATPGYKMKVTDTLYVLSCGTCGIVFAIPDGFDDHLRQTGDTFYCPNGHQRVYRETTEVRLKRELGWAKDRAARARAEADQAKASARAHRGAATRARNERDQVRTRVANGVCPCCNRTFKQLARHMASQHPDFGPIDGHV